MSIGAALSVMRRPRLALAEYLRYHGAARPHRALGQLAPAQAHTRPSQVTLSEHRIRREQVLGGLTRVSRRRPTPLACYQATQATASVVF